MNKKTKEKLITAAIIAAVAAAVVWLFFGGIDHIEDTNGPDDYSLTTVTDEDIINMNLGAKGYKKSTGSISLGENFSATSGVIFSADQFTGVYEVLFDNYIIPSDFALTISGFSVSGGNFKMVVVNDSEIIATIDPAETNEIRIDDLTGYVSLRIAGESAAFQFHISDHEYEQFQHND